MLSLTAPSVNHCLALQMLLYLNKSSQGAYVVSARRPCPSSMFHNYRPLDATASWRSKNKEGGSEPQEAKSNGGSSISGSSPEVVGCRAGEEDQKSRKSGKQMWQCQALGRELLRCRASIPMCSHLAVKERKLCKVEGPGPPFLIFFFFYSNSFLPSLPMMQLKSHC